MGSAGDCTTKRNWKGKGPQAKVIRWPGSKNSLDKVNRKKTEGRKVKRKIKQKGKRGKKIENKNWIK